MEAELLFDYLAYKYVEVIDMAKIFIDAGHNDSGYDTGATGNGLREPDINFNIASRLAALCRAAGHTIFESRPAMNVNVGINASDSINQRAKLANTAKADYFVSIHCNAGGGKGTETLIYAVGGQAEKLAKAVQSAVHSSLGMTNRGVKVRAELGVLRLTNMPAVLIETGYIDNLQDAEKLSTRPTDFADAIFEGIQRCLGEKPDSPFHPDPWAAKAWKKASDKGVVDGTMPKRPVTRQQLAVILDRLNLL